MTKPARRPSRLRLLLPRQGGDRKASLLAFIVQAALIAIVVPSLVVPIAIDFLRDESGRVVTPERITFIAAVPREEGPTEPQRDGGDGRAPSETPAAPLPPIVAPSEPPTTVPPTAGTPRKDAGGLGPLVGGGGPTQGVRPSFNDPRLWQRTTDLIEAPNAPRTRADTLRQMLAGYAASYLDSVAEANPQGRAPGDWTFEKGGKKYGIDQRFIRLGDFSIPTALLALMPLNVQGNPIAQERATRIASMRSEIQYQAARMARDDEFRQAVRALRERKERERKAAQDNAGTSGERKPQAY